MAKDKKYRVNVKLVIGFETYSRATKAAIEEKLMSLLEGDDTVAEPTVIRGEWRETPEVFLKPQGGK